HGAEDGGLAIVQHLWHSMIPSASAELTVLETGRGTALEGAPRQTALASKGTTCYKFSRHGSAGRPPLPAGPVARTQPAVSCLFVRIPFTREDIRGSQVPLSQRNFFTRAWRVEGSVLETEGLDEGFM